MKPIDPIRIRELLGLIQDSRRKLDSLSSLSESDFLADFRNTESAKYLLMIAIEAAIDICNHLAARLGVRAPQDYADCFNVLCDLKLVTTEQAQQLQKMARFRNLLVHMYWQVDNRQVYRILQDNLTDFDEYTSSILKVVES